ncbi:MAG: flagellar hook-length control protein FliK [Holosporales bacterium]
MVNVQSLDLTRLPKQAPEPAVSPTRERSSHVVFEELIIENDHQEESVPAADPNPGMTSQLAFSNPRIENNSLSEGEPQRPLDEGESESLVDRAALTADDVSEGAVAVKEEGDHTNTGAEDRMLNMPRESHAQDASPVVIPDLIASATPLPQSPLDPYESTINPDFRLQPSLDDDDHFFIPTQDKQNIETHSSGEHVEENQSPLLDTSAALTRELPQPVAPNEELFQIENAQGVEAQRQKSGEDHQKSLTLSEEEMPTVIRASEMRPDLGPVEESGPSFQMPNASRQQIKTEELQIPPAPDEALARTENSADSPLLAAPMRSPRARDSQLPPESVKDLEVQSLADEHVQVAVELQGIPVDEKFRTDNPFESAQGTSLPSLSDEVLPLLFAQDNPIRIDMADRNLGQLILPQLAQNGDVPLEVVGSHTPLSEAFHLTAEQVLPQLTTALKSTFTREGADYLRLNLNPASLGKVEVELNISELGHLQMVVCASESNTLDLLQREAETLRQALQEAGYVVDQGAMRFELSQGDSQARQYALPLEEQERGREESQQTSQMTQHSVQVPLADPNRLLDERV